MYLCVMSFQVAGKIYALFDTQDVSATFRKREFVVEYAENPQYPQLVKFEMIQDKCDLLNGYSVGEAVQVSFNLKGREWTSPQGEKKYFTTLDAWRIERAGGQQTAPPPSDPGHFADMPMDDAPGDLPF